MTECTYKPRPGGTAERAKQMLEARGEMTASDLADAIDLEPANQIHASLHLAAVHGYIGKRVVNGVAWFSARPDFAQPADDDPPVHHTVKADECASLAPVAPASVFSQLMPHAFEATAEDEAPAKHRPFACGLFSDGRLVLEVDDQTMTLDRECTEKLCAFLDKLGAVAA